MPLSFVKSLSLLKLRVACMDSIWIMNSWKTWVSFTTACSETWELHIHNIQLLVAIV